jgi:hypothetical protein
VQLLLPMRGSTVQRAHPSPPRDLHNQTVVRKAKRRKTAQQNMTKSSLLTCSVPGSQSCLLLVVPEQLPRLKVERPRRLFPWRLRFVRLIRRMLALKPLRLEPAVAVDFLDDIGRSSGQHLPVVVLHSVLTPITLH